MKRQFYPSWQAAALTLLLAAGGQLCTAQPAYAHIKQIDKDRQGQPKTVSLKEALGTIKAHYGVDIVFADRTIELYRVSAEVLDYQLTIEKNLSNVLRASGLKFKRMRNGSFAILRVKADEQPAGPAESPANSSANTGTTSQFQESILLGAALPAALDRRITGQVNDEKGEALPGVSVILKGKTRGTTTDQNGAFSLEVEEDSDVLIFSYVGYRSREIQVGNRSSLSIILEIDDKLLNEVVVVGYGTVRKSDLTGSVVSLRSDDFNKNGTNTSVAQLIQGRAAGVQVTQSSAAPGGGISIRIRGAGSINAGNEPLYVIDGFPVDNTSSIVANGSGFQGNPPSANPLNALNPSDIESIEILKDASAAAIYGARGANGVVLITTKKGKDGRFTVDYSVTGSSASVLKKLDLLSTSEYINTMNDLAQGRGGKAPFSTSHIQEIGAGTDWQDMIFRTAYTQDHNLSFSGASAKTSFYSSFNYNSQNGVLLNTGFDRYQGRINLEHRASDKFKMGVNINTSQVSNQEIPTSSSAINNDADVINSSLVTPPIFSVFTPEGAYVRPEAGLVVSVTVDNPLALANGISARTVTSRTIGNVYGEYTILPGLSAKVTLGSDRTNSRKDVYQSTITQRGNSFGGGANILTGELSNALFEGIVNYQMKREKHSITALAGYTYQQFGLRRFNGSIQGFVSDVTGTNSLQLGDTNFDELNSLTTTRRLLSYLSRVNYNFNDKYLVTASFRADGSSNFGANRRFGYFPSFAAAWRLAEEDFFKSISFLSDLKLRVGYGQIGNDDIGIGNSFATYGNTKPAQFGNLLYTALAPTRIPNPDLKWETTEQYNAGIDFGFFGERLSGSADYFLKNTRDLLINLPVPAATGFSVITTNIGKIRNTGFELTLNSANMVGKLRWNTSFNIGTLKNRIINIGPIPSIISTLFGTSAIARPGDPLFAYYGYQAEGIFQTADEVAASAQKGVAVPGVPRWKDVNSDGKIDSNDRLILGKSFPDFTFGLNNSFSYGPLNLSIFIDGSQGFSLFNYLLVDALYPNDPYRNRLAEPLLNRWTPQNLTNEWPSSLDITKYGGGMVNNFTVTDASFVRIKNFSLSYTLPVSKVKFLQSASITLSGQNLRTFTRYMGFDPDVNSTSSSIIRVDRNPYPQSRVFSLGLNVKL